MNFNDGTFSWYQEGYFQAWEYPLNIDSSWKEPLRAFYWQDGSNYIWFTTISQGLWLFVLLGVITEAGMLLWTAASTIRRPKYRTEENLSDRLCLSTVMIVTFIGMFLFVMLFEQEPDIYIIPFRYSLSWQFWILRIVSEIIHIL